MAYGNEALFDDHSDTRSGVCNIDFTWTPAEKGYPNEAANSTSEAFLGSAAAAFSRHTINDPGMMVCRGSDGNLYDELECAKSVRPTSTVDEDWLPMPAPAVSASDVMVERSGVTESQCKELGRYPQNDKEAVAIAWTGNDAENQRGTCQIYGKIGMTEKKENDGVVYYRKDAARSRLPTESAMAAAQLQRNRLHQKWLATALRTLASLTGVICAAALMASILVMLMPRVGRVLLCCSMKRSQKGGQMKEGDAKRAIWQWSLKLV
ncbi:hypothetical protein FOL47_010570 [Perkinsus chesapeaki]|uniref:Uncharacterized protein n=1 Tax=Perkinsus chesapeaki TaxID=330153 RepID=A0A7J6MP91_PERCH|nr:hypothetical protein FOL47_010570 [Perkinsus chesapeaki]